MKIVATLIGILLGTVIVWCITAYFVMLLMGLFYPMSYAQAIAAVVMLSILISMFKTVK
jgi:hypothetical protein